MKHAIILAAGTGKRLGSLTRDIPKCLLPIYGGETLLDYSLMALRENGIEKITIVSGFKEEKLKQHISKKSTKEFLFNFVFNSKYHEYNNIYSAYLAKDIWDDETILLNSDIIFHSDILKNLVKHCHCEERERRSNLARDCFAPSGARNDKNSSFLVIDNTKNLTSEDMKVKINEKNEIKEINKNLDIKSSYGEYIGITYLRGFERVRFLESLENNVREGNFDLYYEDAISCILDKAKIFPCSTKGLPWTEVDTIEDYETAKQIAKQLRKPQLV